MARSTSQLCLTPFLILLSSPSIGAAAFIDPSPLSWNNYFFGIISFWGFLPGFSFSSMGLVRDRLLSCMGYRGGMTLFSLSHTHSYKRLTISSLPLTIDSSDSVNFTFLYLTFILPFH